jgi:hypothetical protein
LTYWHDALEGVVTILRSLNHQRRHRDQHKIIPKLLQGGRRTEGARQAHEIAASPR